MVAVRTPLGASIVLATVGRGRGRCNVALLLRCGRLLLLPGDRLLVERVGLVSWLVRWLAGEITVGKEDRDAQLAFGNRA